MTATRTTRTLQLLLAAVYLLLVACGARGDEPLRLPGDFFPVWPAYTTGQFYSDDTARLQAMFNQSRSIDLGGQVWSVRVIRLGPGNWSVRNGTLVCLPDSAADRRYGVFELRGASRATFDDITFAGCLTGYTDDIETNRQRSRDQGMWCAGIIAMNGSRLESFVVRNCRFRRLAVGVQPMGAIDFQCHNCEFEDIATSCIISSVPEGNRLEMQHDIVQCRVKNCGSGFDFSGSAMVATVPRARVMFSTFTNIFGRTKFHGEWNGLVYRSQFRQDRLIPNRFAGLSIPEADQVLIDTCEFTGFLAGGIESSGFQSRPTLTIRNSRIVGGQIAVNSSAWTHIETTEISDSVIPWGGATTPASVIDTRILNSRSNEQQANLFRGGMSQVETWNRLHGTAYDPARWWYVLPAVRAAMQSTTTESEK